LVAVLETKFWRPALPKARAEPPDGVEGLALRRYIGSISYKTLLSPTF